MIEDKLDKDEALRLECLKEASGLHQLAGREGDVPTADDVIGTADRFADYVKTGERPDKARQR